MLCKKPPELCGRRRALGRVTTRMPKRFSESSAKSGLIYCGTRKVKQPPGFYGSPRTRLQRDACSDTGAVHGYGVDSWFSM